jgi:protein O-GlcNAc transferase
MNNDEALFQHAILSLNNGNFVEAEKSFRGILEHQPEHIGALNLLTIVLMALGRYAEAEEFIRSAVRINQSADVSFYNYGIILKTLGRPREAIEKFDTALRLKSDVSETWNNRGTAFNDLNEYQSAIADFDKAIALNESYADAYANKGKSLSELKRHNEAVAAYSKALALKPDLPVAWLGLGSMLGVLRRGDEAVTAFNKALALKPDLAEAWLGLGSVLGDLKRCDEAVAAFDKALHLKPDLADAWLGRGNSLRILKRHDEALTAYANALALAPGLAAIWIGRGNIFLGLKRYEEALSAYDKALALDAGSASGWLGRGNAFFELKRFSEASSAYDKALAFKPDLAEAWLGRGNVLNDLKQYDEAFTAYDKALALKPDLAEAWLGRGISLRALKRYDEAFAAYDKALAIEPNLARAWLGRANAFFELKRYNEAVTAFDKTLALEPDLQYVEDTRLHAKMNQCDWSNFDAESAHLVSSVRKDIVSQPFALLAVSPSPELQLHNASLFSKKNYTAAEKALWRGERYKHTRIRVAYLSADFGEHAVSILLAGLFEQHDRKRFETFAISFEDHPQSEILTRLKGSFDQFITVKNQSDVDVARWLHAHEVDIAIDLMGHTKNARTPIFALRPAPIQVNYLGYPGTMGADFIDYIVADRFTIPEAQRRFYSEKIVYLPDVFQANDSKRTIDNSPSARSEVGLPENAFVFCSFNNNSKITPICFDVWMRLLRKVDGSVLWLLGGDNILERNLRKEAENRGVNPARLIFASRIPYANYLARFRLADLFLDTFPFNAGTTASDALWAGLPIVTCSGEPFASRMAGSLLTSVGLPELVTESLSDYESLAFELAGNPDRMISAKKKLATNLAGCPLFDTRLLTRHIEAAYAAMCERHQANLPPDHIHVPH